MTNKLIPLDQAGVQIEHNFAPGVYAKRVDIPADVKLFQHKHPYAHLSILAAGSALVRMDNGPWCEYTAPACITIEAGCVHTVLAETAVVWYCVHATDETDISKVDQSILNGA